MDKRYNKIIIIYVSPMANILAKNRAHFLRKKGKSITEISEKLKIPRSTVGVWCRDIILGKEQIKRLDNRQKSGSYKGRIIFLEKIRSERLLQSKALKKEGIKEIGNINSRDLFIAGLAFYISEGSTADCGEEVGFTNSDYRTILFMKKWFIEVCGVLPYKFAIQVRINKIHKNNVKKIENYWSRIIEVPLSQFTKTILIKSKTKKVYPKNNIYYGTVRVKIRQGTKLRRKINGWVAGLLENNMPG